MKKAIYILLLISAGIMAKAQIIVPTVSGGSATSPFQLILTYSATGTGSCKVGPTIPFSTDSRACLSPWVEFGDGNFTSGDTLTHRYDPASGLQYQPFVKASGIYTGPTKPPVARTITYSNSGIVTTTGSSPATHLPTLPVSKLIKIIPNLRDVSDEDTMHFAISYKLPTGASGNWTLVFVYNDGAVSNPTFNITNHSTVFDMVDGGGTNNVSFTRYKTGDLFANNDVTLAGLPGITGSNYLAFDVNTAASAGIIKNLFITLVPVRFTTEGTPCYVRAFLLNRNCKTLNTSNSDGKSKLPTCTYSIPQAMNEMQYADTTDLAVRGSQPHDPNFETVRPTCLELPKKTADTLRYHIHFQNTGRGPASMVRVATSIPYMANISKIRLELSNRLRFKVAGSMSVTGYNCSWIINPTADSIIFTFTHTSIAVLNGFTNFTDETTMGDIWFNIPMDANVGSVLLSRSSIVFESTSGSVTHYQPPVITNEARSEYKVRCGECDCKKDPCKKRNRFWQWLLCKKC